VNVKSDPVCPKIFELFPEFFHLTLSVPNPLTWPQPPTQWTTLFNRIICGGVAVAIPHQQGVVTAAVIGLNLHLIEATGGLPASQSGSPSVKTVGGFVVANEAAGAGRQNLGISPDQSLLGMHPQNLDGINQNIDALQTSCW